MEGRNGFPQTSNPRLDWRSATVCQFHAEGRCYNGSKCPFSHEGVPVDPRSRIPCRFFLRGACVKGEKCAFAHGIPKAAATTKKDAPEIWCRELKGALVNFGDGVQVTKVNFPSDFSAVRISGLPPGSDTRSVVHTLGRWGFRVSEGCVRILRQSDNALWSADVRVEDPQFGKRLFKAFVDKKCGTLKVIPVSAPMPQTTNHHRVDSKKIYCTWHQPILAAILIFGPRSSPTHAERAKEVALGFSSGEYTVLNQKVQCDGPRPYIDVSQVPSWAIRLRGLPQQAKEKDIRSAIPSDMPPASISLHCGGPFHGFREANTVIKALLLQAGALESWKGSSDISQKSYKAEARFMTDANARHAVSLFNNKKLISDGNEVILTLQLVHSARMKIPIDSYDAAEEEINSHRQAWKAQNLTYIAFPPAQHHVVLRIEGEVAKDVANAKAALETIIDGEVAMKDGKALWAPSFATNGHAYQKMKELEKDLHIVIVRDKRRSRLRLLGTKNRRQKALTALAELAEADSSSLFIIELNAQQFSWASEGGYRAIVAKVGEDKVNLDIVSSPRRILVTGSEADLKLAQEMVEDMDYGPGGKADGPSVTSDCPICWYEAENPVPTSCKHVYCTGCFEDLCVNAINSGSPIRCQGDFGNCQKVIPLSDIHANLSYAAIEDILEMALTTYAARHPDELRYCPTPDCEQMYRVGKAPGAGDGAVDAEDINPVFTCPTCLVAVCTACHVLHDGLTCAEYRTNAPGSYKALQAAKEEYGIKDCPKCFTMIQKAFGCNHMTCLSCNTHICWVCMKTFAESKPVYEHLRKEHGGVGVVEFLELA